jgi:hypothetical protein
VKSLGGRLNTGLGNGSRKATIPIPAGQLDNYDVPMPDTTPPVTETGLFLESLMDTELYSIGAFFCDEHPDLVDEVIARSEEIERRGLETYSRESEGPIEESFETLLTGLAVRYYKAVAG